MMERFPNLVTMFFTRAAEKGDAPFLWEKYAGRWRALSWSATAEAVARVAEALTELGLQRGDRVLLLSRNRREWCIADLGIMAAGGITVPAYVTGTPADRHTSSPTAAPRWRSSSSSRPAISTLRSANRPIAAMSS